MGEATRGSMRAKISSALCGLSVLVLILGADPGWAADTIKLKDESYVKGPTVVLGDVAEITGENAQVLASIPVGAAAVPGGIKRIDASLLAARIKSAGFEESSVAITGAPTIVAKTMRVEVTKEMVAEDLRRFIQANTPWNPEDTTISVTTPSQDLSVPEGELSLNWIPNPTYKYLGPGVFRGEVRVDGTVCRTMTCQANIEAYGQVVVTATDIPRGKVITPSDVALEKRPLLANASDPAQNLDEVVGKAAKSTLFPGQVIGTRQLVAKQVIKRNQIVVVEAKAGSLVVQTRARAMADGREGEALTCQNTESKDELTGTVRGDGVVEVQ